MTFDPGGRVLYAGLHLLDRQIVDREGRPCGKVDDVELEERDGTLYVAALLTGPGALLRRTGHHRLGGWLREHAPAVTGPSLDRIPLARVADIGDHVTVSLRSEELATFGGERWVRDHLIGPIPGSG